MPVTLTSRLQFSQQDEGDLDWEVPLNDGFARADQRLLKTSRDQDPSDGFPLSPRTGILVGSANPPTITGTFSGSGQVYYLVEIVSGDPTNPNTYRWSDDGGLTFQSTVGITGSPQGLNNGLSITFPQTTGYANTDAWTFSGQDEVWDPNDRDAQPLALLAVVGDYVGQRFYSQKFSQWYTCIVAGDENTAIWTPDGAEVGAFELGWFTSGRLGWLFINTQGTIGSASSGADIWANADARRLYKHIWDNFSDLLAPVTGGRGASANFDFDADKPIAIPQIVARNIRVAGEYAAVIPTSATYFGPDASPPAVTISGTFTGSSPARYTFVHETDLGSAGTSVDTIKWYRRGADGDASGSLDADTGLIDMGLTFIWTSGDSNSGDVWVADILPTYSKVAGEFLGKDYKGSDVSGITDFQNDFNLAGGGGGAQAPDHDHNVYGATVDLIGPARLSHVNVLLRV